MVSLDVIYMYTNIPAIDRLNIIKGYINNDDQFTRKSAMTQDKFLELRTITACLSHSNKRTPQISKKKRSERV